MCLNGDGAVRVTISAGDAWPRRVERIELDGADKGLRRPEGGNTPPLLAHAGGPGRIGELATGVGQRE